MKESGVYVNATSFRYEENDKEKRTVDQCVFLAL